MVIKQNRFAAFMFAPDVGMERILFDFAGHNGIVELVRFNSPYKETKLPILQATLIKSGADLIPKGY